MQERKINNFFVELQTLIDQAEYKLTIMGYERTSCQKMKKYNGAWEVRDKNE